MVNLQEIARLVREELLTLIQPVQLLAVNPDKSTGDVAGRFRSNGVLFDYTIGRGTVRYRPVGAGGERADDFGIEVMPRPRLDAARGKPRNCSTGYACGATCIQKGKVCKAKGGAAAKAVTAIVKAAGGRTAGPAAKAQPAAAPTSRRGAAKGAAKGPAKGPGLSEARSAVLGYFGAKTVAAMKADEQFQMATAGSDNPLKSKEDWLKLYRQFVGVPKNERNLPDGPTVINGVDVVKNFRPWHTFGLDPKTATPAEIRSAFRRLIKQHHPDQGGDPRVPERLKKMRDSMLALRAEPRRDSVATGRPPGWSRWSAARQAGYAQAQAATARLDGRRRGAKNCTTGISCGDTCIEAGKECRQPSGGAAGKLGDMVRSQASGRESRAGTHSERRIAAKTAQRERIAQQLVADLSRPRPDGQGTFIEYPDAAAMKRIDSAGKRVAALDRELNELEGRDPEHKRWVEGDPYGLGRYSDFESPARAAYEGELISDRLHGATRTGQAVFLSGGPASGKSTLRQREFGDAEGFVTIDPDELKGEDPVMAIGVALGMRAAAALAHENSSRLAKRLYATARDQGLDVLVDGTGANAGKYIEQMQDLRGKGYTVTLLAQHVPEEVGVDRALKRADKAGRYVPPEFIRHAYEVIPGNFERLAQVADRATLNDGQSNQVIMRYEGGTLAGGDAKRTADYRRRYGRPSR